MTRTGKAARLSAHMAEPFAEIHPDDAAALSIRPATLVRLQNRHGSVVVRALLTDRQQRGHIFVPMHWTDQFASNGRVDALATAKTDPVSGQPALKMALVGVEPVHTVTYGFFVARDRPALEAAQYWAIAEATGGVRGELGFSEEPNDWGAWVRQAFGTVADADLVSVVDKRSGRRKYALLEGGRLVFAIYLGPDPVLVARQWVVEQLDANNVDGAGLVAGRPGADAPDNGAIVCACESVGVVTITDAVVRQGCTTVEAVGVCTRAGTNCGSCRAEIRAIIAANQLVAAE